jgi:hypothetical protein
MAIHIGMTRVGSMQECGICHLESSGGRRILYTLKLKHLRDTDSFRRYDFHMTISSFLLAYLLHEVIAMLDPATDLRKGSHPIL